MSPNFQEAFEKDQRSMSDEKLIELCESEIHKLCKTGGRSITMTVPPQVKDTDMLLCELIRRFKHHEKGK